MYFFTTGRPAPPVHFDTKRQEARFTLRDRNDRYYVITTSMEQYDFLKANPEQELLVIGSVFSFRCSEGNCHAHRVGFRPMLLMPLNNGNLEQAEQIMAQLVKFSLKTIILPRLGD